jgi:hypothetical protein
MPYPDNPDPRMMTNLDVNAFFEASKAWAADVALWRPADALSMQTAMWESCIAALRVYEFERAKSSSDGQQSP